MPKSAMTDATNLEQQLLARGHALAQGKGPSLRPTRLKQAITQQAAEPTKSPKREASASGSKPGPRKAAPTAPPAAKRQRTTAPPKAKILTAEQQEQAARMERLVPQRQVFNHPAGEEPFRKHDHPELQVNMEPQISRSDCEKVSRRQRHYEEQRLLAVPAEQKRVEKARKERGPGGKNPCARPDTACFKPLEKMGQLSTKAERVFGHFPGIQIGHRFTWRAEMKAIGAHFEHQAGIAHRTLSPPLPDGCDKIVESIVMTGGYEDDVDDGDYVVYTSGNDRLGPKKQTADQILGGAAIALVGNIHLGIPVRLFRGFPDGNNSKPSFLSYDGLYKVTSFWAQKGGSGYDIYQFAMQRLAAQGPLHDREVMFVGGSKRVTNAQRVQQQRQQHQPILDDWTQGLGGIEVAVVNQHDSEEPPLAVTGPPQQGQLQYVQEAVRGPGVPTPQPAVVPQEFVGNPHSFLRQLNGGDLPYMQQGTAVPQLAKVQGVVYECGPWTGCRDCQNGGLCVQAASQMPMRYKLELFQTKGRGWGLRALEAIPSHVFICAYAGLMLPKAAAEEGADSPYVFDCSKRNDFTADGRRCPDGETDPHHESLYEVDAANMGNIARFVNHSCDANLFVQPVLGDHHDVMQARICLFSARAITLYEELTLDYGPSYLATLPQCCCGRAQCVKPHTLPSP